MWKGASEFDAMLDEEINRSDSMRLLISQLLVFTGCTDKNKLLDTLKQWKKDLIFKASQDRVSEILGIKRLNDDSLTLTGENYRVYLSEAELIYNTRPFKDIIKKYQKDQVDYIMKQSDGGEIGQLQQLVSRGGILFAEYAEKELNNLHLQYLDVKTGNVEIKEEEKYKIFN